MLNDEQQSEMSEQSIVTPGLYIQLISNMRGNYQASHQPLSRDDASRGLQRERNVQRPKVAQPHPTTLKQKSPNVPPLGRRQFNQQQTPTSRVATQKKGLDSYKSTTSTMKKQVANTRHHAIELPAPSTQFKRYLSDAQNVFYEDSANMKSLRRMKTAKLYLSVLLIVMVTAYIGIGRIVPFPEERCPSHAVCNVFVHCHKGYTLRDGACIVDPLIINKAKEISEAVVSQLSYNFGDSECLSEGGSLAHSASIYDVLRQFNVEYGSILEEEISMFFSSHQNQEKYHFHFKIYTITALEKQYSLTCATNLFIKSPSFKYYMAALLFLVLGAIYQVRRIAEAKRAAKVYQFLRNKTLCQEQLSISECKGEGESLYGKWTKDLWMKVDLLRYKDSLITYYEEHEELYWKRVV